MFSFRFSEAGADEAILPGPNEDDPLSIINPSDDPLAEPAPSSPITSSPPPLVPVSTAKRKAESGFDMGYTVETIIGKIF
jgi:hypothetical protein